MTEVGSRGSLGTREEALLRRAAKAMLRIAGALGALLLVLLAVILLLLLFEVRVNVASFRGVIEEAAGEAAGRPVAIAEPLTLRISIFPDLHLGGLRVAGEAEEGDFLRLGSTDVAISLPALLRREVVVTKLAARKVRVRLEGKGPDSDPVETAPAAEVPAHGSGEGFRFAGVESFFVYDLDLDRGDGESPLTGLSIRRVSGRAVPGEPFALQAEGTWRAKPVRAVVSTPAIDGIAALERPWPLKVRAGVPGLDVGAVIHGPGPDGGGLEADVDLSGDEFADAGWIAGAALPPAGPFSLLGRLSLGGGAPALASGGNYESKKGTY